MVKSAPKLKPQPCNSAAHGLLLSPGWALLHPGPPGGSELPEGSCVVNKRGEKKEIWGAFSLGLPPSQQADPCHATLHAEHPSAAPPAPQRPALTNRMDFVLKLLHGRGKQDLNNPK